MKEFFLFFKFEIQYHRSRANSIELIIHLNITFNVHTIGTGDDLQSSSQPIYMQQ